MKIYCLMFPTPEGETFVRGSEAVCRDQAELWLFDRRENGEAFPAEYVALVRRADYLRATGQYVPCTELP